MGSIFDSEENMQKFTDEIIERVLDNIPKDIDFDCSKYKKQFENCWKKSIESHMDEIYEKM